MASAVPIAILGAGLTGLSAALALARAGVRATVFEKTREVGGHAGTLEEEGYRFDRTGHLLHLRNDRRRAQVLELLAGECLELERRSVVFSHGVYTRYPFQANTHGLPPEVAYECLLGFIEAELRPDPRPLNFEEYCQSYFGAGFSRHFMLPYNTKLFGVPLNEITTEWCERFVPRPKLDDVVAGAVGLADRKLGYNARFLYPKRGIGELPRAMAARARDVRLGVAPRLVRPARRELVFERETVRYDALVSTIPLPVLLSLLEDVPSEVLAARAELRATELYYLDIALSVPARKAFHWAYVPEPRFPFYRVGYYSAFSPEMAPSGRSSLYVELAQRERPNLDALLPDVLSGLTEMGVIQARSDVAFVRLRHLEHAYVIYDRQHANALRVIQSFLGSLGIVSSGRYGGWNYSSMEDALDFGEDAARRALELGRT